MIETLKDLWLFIKKRKKWVFLPVILILLLVGAIVLIYGGSAIAPFIYTLF